MNIDWTLHIGRSRGRSIWRRLVVGCLACAVAIFGAVSGAAPGPSKPPTHRPSVVKSAPVKPSSSNTAARSLTRHVNRPARGVSGSNHGSAKGSPANASRSSKPKLPGKAKPASHRTPVLPTTRPNFDPRGTPYRPRLAAGWKGGRPIGPRPPTTNGLASHQKGRALLGSLDKPHSSVTQSRGRTAPLSKQPVSPPKAVPRSARRVVTPVKHPSHVRNGTQHQAKIARNWDHPSGRGLHRASSASASEKGKRLAAESATQLQVFSVGPYNKLTGNIPGKPAGLDAHHVGQAALMKRLIPGYNYKTAPAILVPRVGHTLAGVPGGGVARGNRGVVGPLTPRSVLARDIRELRRVYPDVTRAKLQELIRLNKEQYPGAFLK